MYDLRNIEYIKYTYGSEYITMTQYNVSGFWAGNSGVAWFRDSYITCPKATRDISLCEYIPTHTLFYI